MMETITPKLFVASHLSARAGGSYRIDIELGQSEQKWLVMYLSGGNMTLRASYRRLKNAEYDMARQALEPRLAALVYLTEALGRDLAGAGFTLLDLSHDTIFNTTRAVLRGNTGTSRHRLLAGIHRGSFEIDWVWPGPVRTSLMDSDQVSNIEKMLREAAGRITETLPESIEAAS